MQEVHTQVSYCVWWVCSSVTKIQVVRMLAEESDIRAPSVRHTGALQCRVWRDKHDACSALMVYI